MASKGKFLDNNVVSLSALDMFANALGTLAFLLLLFSINAIEATRPSSLKILTQHLPASQSGVEYLGALSVIGGVPPYTWVLRHGALPEGLSLDSARGEITGIPSAIGEGSDVSLDIQVSDSRKKQAHTLLELRVMSAKNQEYARGMPLVILTHGKLPDGIIQAPYSLYISARGGSGRYRWSTEGLPAGFSLDEPSGLLAGTPHSSGTYEIVFRVRDEQEGRGDAGNAVSTGLLEIRATDQSVHTVATEPAPVILTRTLPPATVAENYELQLAGTGAFPLKWSSRNLPAGLTISDSGLIRGTILSPATLNLSIGLTDSVNRSAPEDTLTLIVRPRPFSAFGRVKERGLWAWLGYVLLALLEVGYFYGLTKKAARHVATMLKLYNVNLIHKPDGTTSLNGPAEGMDAVERELRKMHEEQRRFRQISYLILGIAVVAFTVFLVT